MRKQEAGERLTLLAMKERYYRGTACNGPRLKSYEIGDGAVTLWFSDVALGISARPSGAYAEARYGTA
ncbi:MAG: hypothetical protein J6Z38_04425, partial [Lachnospiraceae bacterium]|nr:hypothetical protein [Lachnospiraceae bacterium]